VIFLPVAVMGGAFSWAEFDSDANGMLNGFRQYTYAVALALHERKAAPAPFAVPSRYYDPFDASTAPVQASAPAPSGTTIAAPVPAPAPAPESAIATPPIRPMSLAGSSVGACAHCGAPVYPGWKACPSCGERVPATKLK
ncbi:MAG TPA: zinc ribbon domain-containing protein, partial [Thermoplasmata archaeon]|nr:zinc ribbon domain-containing protein [Thermoplasmata archaeon]